MPVITVLDVEVECPRCATISTRHESLQLVPGRILAVVEAVICMGCGLVLTGANTRDMATY